MKVCRRAILASALATTLAVWTASSANAASNDCISQSPSGKLGEDLINIAPKGTASQSSTGRFRWEALPELAIDGNTNGNYWQHSVAHTLQDPGAWWQVDLGTSQPIEKVVVWNRTDGGWGRRLSDFRLVVLDEESSVVFEQIYCRGGASFSPAMVVDMPESTSGRIIKVMLNGTNYLQLAEVEVLAKASDVKADQPAPPQWEVVGYWNYDPVDGQQLVHGLTLRSIPGESLGQSWEHRLELNKHAELRARERTLWPVTLSRTLKKVCANYPGYPSYVGHIDLPGEKFDGTYTFGQCSNAPSM